MWRLCAWNDRGWLVGLALTAAFAVSPPLLALEQRTEPELRVAQSEGPLPLPEAAPPQSVLLLPTRGHARSAVGAAAVDVLLRNTLEDLGNPTSTSELRSAACAYGRADFAAARQAYLDLELDEALARAKDARQQLLKAQADLWSCSELDTVELFLAQTLVDRHDPAQAEVVLTRIIARGAIRAPDPAQYTPDLQALWAKVADHNDSSPYSQIDTEALAELGRASGAAWVVAAVLLGREDAGERLLLAVVSTQGPAAQTAVVPLRLSTKGGWGATLRAALLPIRPDALGNDPRVLDAKSLKAADQGAKKPPFYKRWWFWTAVGVVVVGGAAAIVGAALANDDPGPTTVNLDL